MISIYDQQSGKIVTGEPVNITQYTFDLISEEGAILGTFPIDNLPDDYPYKT